jgi:hypothetical protein
MSTAMLKDPDLAGQGRLKVEFACARLPASASRPACT